MNPGRMQSGRLNQLVTWQINKGSPDDGSCGQVDDVWQTQQVLWAEALPMSGDAPFNAQQVRPARTERFRLRGGPAIQAGHRLVLDGRDLTVSWARREDERGFWLLVDAAEVAAGVAGGP